MGEIRRVFKFLGTGAADWAVPEADGEYRRFSSLLVDDDLLLDCPASILDAMAEFAAAPHLVKTVLITHSHADHLHLATLCELDRLCREKGQGQLAVYAHSVLAASLREKGLQATGLAPDLPFQVGARTITPLVANHPMVRQGELALHYLVTDKVGTWLYATDGSWLRYEAWVRIKDQQLDALVLDATIGDAHPADWRIFEHNSLAMIRLMVEAMQQNEILKPEAVVILTHLARTLHPAQKELDASLQKPYIAAYDGLEHVFS